MPQELLAARHISKHFGGVQALRNVSLALHAGEIRCLAGENGSGKSTFIKIIAGVDKPDAGEIVIGRQPFAHLEPIWAIREGIQVIYQDFALFPNLTVAENLALNTELERGGVLVNWRRIRRTAMQAMGKLAHYVDPKKTLGELSVADKQLVAISRALLQNARILIMDEPTTALTRKEVCTLFRVVRELKERGMSILFVSHKLHEVLEISDTISVLRNGRKVAEGDVSEFSHGDLVYHMTARQTLSRPRHSDAQTGAVMLKAMDLSKTDTFEHVNLEVRSGEIVGVTGLLGSGRRELALALFGLEPADSGQIVVDGRVVRIRRVQDAVEAGIAYVPEDRLTEGLFAEQSIERNIAISNTASLANRAGWIRSARLRDIVGRWTQDLRIQAPSMQMPVGRLSGGNQQKVVLGRWLATQAKVLILNGPTVGVDVGAKADVHEKIQQLARRGIAVLLISDDLPELLELCRRILVMHRGRIVKELEAADSSEDTLAAELGALK